MMNYQTDILLGSDGTSQPARYKDYFDLTEPMSILGLCLLAIMIIVSTLGGVSGSNLMVPIFLIFFKFDQKVSVAHTVVLSTLSCIIRLVYEKVFSKKGSNTKNLINFHLVMIGTAPAILGAFIGVQLNHISPNIVIVIFTTILQLLLLIFSCRTFLKKRKAEAEQKAVEDTLALEKNDALTLEDMDDQHDNSSLRPTAEPLLETEDENNSANPPEGEPDYHDLLEPEDPANDQYQITNIDILGILVMFLLNPFMTTLRVTVADDWYEVKKCTMEDALLILVYIVVIIAFGSYQIFSILKRNKNKTPKTNDVNLGTMMHCIWFAAGLIGVSFIGGFLAAGSSTLLTIFMIGLNIYPFVASSTTLLLSVIFYGSSAFINIIKGQVYPGAALLASIVVVVSTVATRMTLYETFLKHGKASIIVLFISISMLMSIPSNLAKVAPHIRDDYARGVDIWAFNGLCS